MYMKSIYIEDLIETYKIYWELCNPVPSPGAQLKFEVNLKEQKWPC